MEHELLSYKNSFISYVVFGYGPQVAVCFHGYGEDGNLYGFFEKYAGAEFKFVCVDLPFHGNTQWNEGLEIAVADLDEIIRKIFNKNGIDPGKKFSILGFSLGGRIALSLYQVQPAAIKKIILFAPDGLTVNPWYWFATQTWVGNQVFAFSMRNPGWFLACLKLGNKLGLVNASVFKFVKYYIGNSHARQLLYQRWTTLRKLRPDLAMIKSCIKKHKTSIELLYGKYDRFILPVRGERFQKGIEEFCTITIIDSGHQVVHEKHAEQIMPALLHSSRND